MSPTDMKKDGVDGGSTMIHVHLEKTVVIRVAPLFPGLPLQTNGDRVAPSRLSRRRLEQSSTAALSRS